MTIFNTTFHVEDSIHDNFLEYLKNEYIPKSLSNGMLSQPCLSKIERQYEDNGISYSLQLRVENIDILNEWTIAVGEALQKELASKFGSKVSGFITLMEEIPLSL